MTIAARVTIRSHIKKFHTDFTAEMESKMDVAAELLKATVQRSLRVSNQKGMSPSAEGTPPHRGLSSLINSITWERTGRMRRIVGTRLAYGRIQEYGGWIYAGDKRMPVPISREAKAHKTNGGSSRTFPKELTFIHRGNRRPGLLVEKRKKRWIVHYALASKVYLPARPYLRPAAEDPAFHNKLERLFDEGAGFSTPGGTSVKVT